MYARILEPSHDVQFEALYLIIKRPDGISSVHSDWSVVSLISLVSISNTMSGTITIDNGELSLLKRPIQRVCSTRTHHTSAMASELLQHY